jgi:hypothetical protein
MGDAPPAAPPVAGSGPDTGVETVVLAEPPALSDEQLEAAFTALRDAASSYNDRLSAQRAEGLRLYNGDPMGDEEEGRSQIVLTEVQDTVAAIMPTIMRVFAGAEHPVLFVPTQEGAEEQAAQATDYVQYVIFRDCDGFRAIHDAAHDAATLKVGWIRWGWDQSVKPVTEHYSGLLEQQAAPLITQPGVRALRVSRRPATDDERMGLQASPEGALIQLMPGVPVLLWDVTLVRKVQQDRPFVAAVPSENVWIDPDASGPDDARGVFIVTETTVGDLVALGLPEDMILRHLNDYQAGRQDKVKRARDRTAASATRDAGWKGDPSMRRVTYTEGWIKVDYDGDGIAELRRVQAVGQTGQTILAHQPADCVPLARLIPFAVPHKAVGQSFADRVGDLQRVNSRIMRNILDSMTEAIHPRTVIVDGQVPVDDVLNTEMGAVLRERTQGAIRELVKPFIGPQAAPLLDVTAAIKESRTGITRGSQGFNAETLQSTAPIAVSAQISAAQDRIELTLRWIAEGMRAVYAGVLALMAEHQDRPRAVRLRGHWVPVDPRAWLGAFAVETNVAVGRGSMAERLQVLGMIAGKQEQILSTYGPQNPLVTIGQYRATLADMMAAAGIVSPDRYFRDIPPDWVPPAPPPQPTSDQLLAQVEISKTQANTQLQLQQERGKTLAKLLDDDRERDKARVEALLQAAEIRGRYPGTAELDPRALSSLLSRDPDLTVAIAGMLQPIPPPQPPPAAALPPGSPGGAPTIADSPGQQFDADAVLAQHASATPNAPAGASGAMPAPGAAAPPGMGPPQPPPAPVPAGPARLLPAQQITALANLRRAVAPPGQNLPP